MINVYFKRVQTRAAWLIEKHIEEEVFEFQDKLTNFTLSDEEEAELVKLWEANSMTHDELNKIHHKFVKRIEVDLINPLYKRIHHFRLLTIFVNQSDYNRFLTSINLIIDTIWETVNHFSVNSIQITLNEFEQAKLLSIQAALDTNAIGHTIEE